MAGWERVIPRRICGEAKPRGYEPSAPGNPPADPREPSAHRWAQGPRDPTLWRQHDFNQGAGPGTATGRALPQRASLCAHECPVLPGLPCAPAHPSFERLSGQSSFASERFEINLLLLRDSGLTVDPKSLSQKIACLFLQSGFSPHQPRQPSKYCSFWTLSCWTSNGSACSHSTLVVGREGATLRGCGHLGWDVHVVSLHWCVFEEKNLPAFVYSPLG